MAAIACNHWDLFVFCQLAVAYGIGETDHRAGGLSGDETQPGLNRQQGINPCVTGYKDVFQAARRPLAAQLRL